MDPLYIFEIEHAGGVLEYLCGPDPDHAGRRQGERSLAIELDLTRTCHGSRLDERGGRG
jgi:hypothetical protein